MTTLMKDIQLECQHLCTKGNSCVSAATFEVGSWNVAFTHWVIDLHMQKISHSKDVEFTAAIVITVSML